MKFEYPIKLNDSTVQRQMGSNNRFGFYPIGRLNAWHGGIHLEGEDIEVKAIADGEIIAYRLPTKYSDETILKKTHQYSNGFVLIKHYYKSPKGQELTFYSLYLHLMSKGEILAKNKKIPDLFAKKVSRVTANDKIVGLNAINMLDEDDIPFVIPYGATVQFDDMPSWLESLHWSKDEKHKDDAYRRIKYTDSDGKAELNILISTVGNRVTQTPFINEVKINTKEHQGSEEGAVERRSKDTDSEALRIIPKGTEIEIEPEEGNKWGKIKYKEGKKPAGQEGYILLSNVERTEVFDDEKNVYEKVKNCNIPVKAGELIGYTGAYGFEQNPNYRTAHVEVFTGDEVSDFLTDSKNDGEKEKKYFKLLQGAVLKKAMPYKLVQETSVKIISEQGNYTQVELGPLIREAYKVVGNVEHLKYQPSGKYYDIVPDHFETINCNFNNALNKDDKLYLVKELEGNLRRLRYNYPIKGEKYWVPTAAIQRDEPPPSPAALLPVLEAIPPAGYSRQPNTTVDSTAESATSSALAASETATASAPTETTVTDQAKLIVDVEELYLEYPDDCEEDDKIPKDIILKAADFKKVKQNDGTYSYLIICECLENGIGVTKKGWISDTDSKLKKISPYNWEEFGFKVIKDNQDELIYTPDAPPQFLKDVWKQIDADCNNVLTEQELRYALKNKSISEKLSHLVCLHTSEWSYKESKLSSLKSRLNTLFDEGIKEEEDAVLKQELKDKKKAVLDAMEARVKNLSWWNEVKDNALFVDNPFATGAAKPEKKKAVAEPIEIPFAPEEELKGPTLFPVSKPKVYHFHPLAFVRQMRRLYGNLCIINRKYFYDQYAIEFGGVSDELKNDIEIILEGIEKYKTVKGAAFNKKQIAYILATIKHETGNFKPVIESYWVSEKNRKKYYEEMYDPILGKSDKRRKMALANENEIEGDGARYAGKGYVQLTWKRNYRKAKEKFGVDFIENPDLALVPKHSIDIALYGFDSGIFTGKCIFDYIDNTKSDYFNARRVINGTDAAELIKNYAIKIEKCLKVSY